MRIRIEPFQSTYGTGALDGVAWVPGTTNVSRFTDAKIAATTLGTGAVAHMTFIAKKRGTYPIEVIAKAGWTSYRLSWSVGASSSSSGTSLR